MKLFYLALRHNRNRILAFLILTAVPFLAISCASTVKCARHTSGEACATCCKGSCDACCKGGCEKCPDCAAGKCC